MHIYRKNRKRPVQSCPPFPPHYSHPVQTERRAQLALKRWAIFPVTTLDTYDFDYPKSIDKDVVERAATLDFMKDRTNVVLIGPSGVGKTKLANAIGQLACLRSNRVRFVTAADLVNDVVAVQARNGLHRRLAVWASYELVLVDELGYLESAASQPRGARLRDGKGRPRRGHPGVTGWSRCLQFGREIHVEGLTMPSGGPRAR